MGAASRSVATSTNPAVRKRAAVSSGEAKFHGPGQPAKYPANGARAITRSASACASRRLGPPPHCACRRPPGRSAAHTCAKSAAWSGTQWKVAVLNTHVGPARHRHGRQRRLHERHARAEDRLQVGAGLLQHVPRPIERHHVSAGQPFRQRRSESSAAAAGVDRRARGPRGAAAPAPAAPSSSAAPTPGDTTPHSIPCSRASCAPMVLARRHRASTGCDISPHGRVRLRICGRMTAWRSDSRG